MPLEDPFSSKDLGMKQGRKQHVFLIFFLIFLVFAQSRVAAEQGQYLAPSSWRHLHLWAWSSIGVTYTSWIKGVRAIGRLNSTGKHISTEPNSPQEQASAKFISNVTYTGSTKTFSRAICQGHLAYRKVTGSVSGPAFIQCT